MADYEKNLVVIITTASFDQTDRWREAVSGINMNSLVIRPSSDNLPQLIEDAEFIMVCVDNVYEIESYSFALGYVQVHNEPFEDWVLYVDTSAGDAIQIPYNLMTLPHRMVSDWTDFSETLASDLGLCREIYEEGYDSKRVFVCMPFTDKDTGSTNHWDSVYDAISSGARRGGARLVERVKDIAGHGFQTQNFIKIQIEHCDYAVADLTEMRPNVLMEAGYMFGCGHDNSDLLLVGQVGKSPESFYGAHVLQYENASDLEVAVTEWFERRVG
jgi:hypothetical protein